MNKHLKTVYYLSVIFLICFFGYFICSILFFSHKTDWEKHKEYLWIFNDSVKNEINVNISYSYVKNQDIYNCFHYKEYNIIVWEFKNLYNLNLKNINFHQYIYLRNVKFISGQILNKNSDLEITIKYWFDFDSILNLNLDENSRIEGEFKSSNYKGFYGTIKKMSMSNSEYEHQILFDYTEQKEPSTLIVYKGHGSFFLIIINSKNHIDEKIVSILNLSG
jgi:hypothetical protein